MSFVLLYTYIIIVSRCKAYINPFVQFVDGGRRFVCNLCGFANEVPQEYFCNLDYQGRRMDINERFELLQGTVDFNVTSVCVQKIYVLVVTRVAYEYTYDIFFVYVYRNITTGIQNRAVTCSLLTFRLLQYNLECFRMSIYIFI